MLGPYFHRNTATSNCRTSCPPGTQKVQGPSAIILRHHHWASALPLWPRRPKQLPAAMVGEEIKLHWSPPVFCIYSMSPLILTLSGTNLVTSPLLPTTSKSRQTAARSVEKKAWESWVRVLTFAAHWPWAWTSDPTSLSFHSFLHGGLDSTEQRLSSAPLGTTPGSLLCPAACVSTCCLAVSCDLMSLAFFPHFTCCSSLLPLLTWLPTGPLHSSTCDHQGLLPTPFLSWTPHTQANTPRKSDLHWAAIQQRRFALDASPWTLRPGQSRC